MRTANYTDLRNKLDEYNAIKETEYLTSSPKMMKRLRKAEDNMNKGKGTKINIANL